MGALTEIQLEQRRRNVKAIAERRRRQTHCKRGHPLSGDNLRVKVDKYGHTHRNCFTCLSDSSFYKWRGIIRPDT